jgi:glutamate-1-semialdehyde 2,1-aminomutase/spore coat polysaccharide biosynthesis protein SpsF
MKTWNERAKAVFAQGCNTYSKRADQHIEGVYPTHADPELCEEAWIYGATGGKYIDFVCGLGSNLIDIQNNYSLPSTQEVVLAERIKALFPCIDKLKIVKTGSAACSAAVRIARAYTGKMLVWGTGYHGTDNWTIAAEEPGTGTVFEFYQKFPDFDNLISNLKQAPDNLAAVIIEPVQLDMNVRPQLEEIRALCTAMEIVLIFDEVITGFRFLNYSVSNYFGIQPDLICLGKALGNGYPIAIVGGREEIMETQGYFISNTHNGELSALEAALKTLDFLSHSVIADLWNRGKSFQDAFNALTQKLKIVGYPTRGELRGDDDFKALFMQEMCRRGYFFGRAWFICHAHTSVILGDAIAAAADVVRTIESGLVKLEGPPPRPVFKRNA